MLTKKKNLWRVFFSGCREGYIPPKKNKKTQCTPWPRHPTRSTWNHFRLVQPLKKPPPPHLSFSFFYHICEHAPPHPSISQHPLLSTLRFPLDFETQELNGVIVLHVFWTAGWRGGGWRRWGDRRSASPTLMLSLSFFLSFPLSPFHSQFCSLSLSLWSSRCRFGHERTARSLRKYRKKPCLVWKLRRVSDSKIPLNASLFGLLALNHPSCVF